MTRLSKLLKAIGLKKKERSETEELKARIETNAASQTYVLSSRMTQAGVQHMSIVEADLDRVRIGSGFSSQGGSVITFCGLGELKVNSIISHGDGKYVHSEHAECGLYIKASEYKGEGSYRIKNAQIYSNGAIQLTRTDKTVIEYID